jgi:hypothetical protein|tara:strand:- start:43 stop:291 length:249 start_codon:yes stop_codon:yes gene_type:complete
MKFIGSEQLRHRKAIKDGRIVDKGKDNVISMPVNTTISFGDLIEVTNPKTGKPTGDYTLTLTATRTFPRTGSQSKSIILKLQ